MLILAAVYIVYIGIIFVSYAAGRWLVFKKMGLPGWKGIIPFYSESILFRRLWTIKMFWAYTALFFVYFLVCASAPALGFSGFFQAVNRAAGVLIVLLILAAAYGVMAVMFVILFKLNNRLAKSFGRTAGFAVGLTFIPPVFFMILGLNKSEYNKDNL